MNKLFIEYLGYSGMIMLLGFLCLSFLIIAVLYPFPLV